MRLTTALHRLRGHGRRRAARVPGQLARPEFVHCPRCGADTAATRHGTALLCTEGHTITTTGDRPMSEQTTITAVDGTDALAFVIIRPGETEGAVSIEAAAKGLSKTAAAYVLRQVADMWDAENGQ